MINDIHQSASVRMAKSIEALNIPLQKSEQAERTLIY